MRYAILAVSRCVLVSLQEGLSVHGYVKLSYETIEIEQRRVIRLTESILASP